MKLCAFLKEISLMKRLQSRHKSLNAKYKLKTSNDLKTDFNVDVRSSLHCFRITKFKLKFQITQVKPQLTRTLYFPSFSSGNYKLLVPIFQIMTGVFTREQVRCFI